MKLRGTGKRPQDVVLVWGDSNKSAGGTGKSASVWASGDGFEARNLTIQNDYHLSNPERSQAVALRVTADRAVLSHVRLLGAQDTLYAASKSPDSPSRQLFEHCYIEGQVDFIFGRAVVRPSVASLRHRGLHAYAHRCAAAAGGVARVDAGQDRHLQYGYLPGIRIERAGRERCDS